MDNLNQKKKILKNKQKQVVKLVICLLLVLGISVGGTMAFLVTKTNKVENKFNDSSVMCEVTETFENNIKSNVAIKNTGDTQAYIRAYINVTWMDAEGNIFGNKPVENQDYELVFAEENNWIEINGYWYYQLPVNPQDSTDILISSCKLIDSASIPDGYSLSVEIVCSAVQSTPTDAVKQCWNVEIMDNKIVRG